MHDLLSKVQRFKSLRCLYDMACVSKKDTGLPYDIWIDSKGRDRGPSYEPCIKVDVKGKHREMPEISIAKEPEIRKGTVPAGANEIIEWVKRYYDILMHHF